MEYRLQSSRDCSDASMQERFAKADERVAAAESALSSAHALRAAAQEAAENAEARAAAAEEAAQQLRQRVGAQAQENGIASSAHDGAKDNGGKYHSGGVDAGAVIIDIGEGYSCLS